MGNHARRRLTACSIESSLRRTRSGLSATAALPTPAQVAALDRAQVLRTENDGSSPKLELGALTVAAAKQHPPFTKDLGYEEGGRTIDDDEIHVVPCHPLELLRESILCPRRRSLEQ